MSKYVCYLIASEVSNRTYIGITTDLHRRIRQHNSIIKGGAKSTAGRGPWKYVCVISGFPNDTVTMQFEWRNHNPKIRRSGIKGRLKTMTEIFNMEKWTSKCDRIEPSSLTVTFYSTENEIELHPAINIIKKIDSATQ